MLIAHDLTRRFGAVPALDGVTLTEGPGCVAVVGANGAGKSTLLRLAATLLRPDRGTIAIAGHDTVTHPERVRRAIGYVAPHMRLPPRLTGREVLQFTAHAFGIENRSRIDAVVERFAISAWLDRPTAGLSTGEHQRLNLARAVLSEPAVLLVDEPSTGLDLPAQARLRRDLDGLRDGQRLIVLASHDPLEIAALADRVVVLRGGTVAWRGPTAELGEATSMAARLEALIAGDACSLPV